MSIRRTTFTIIGLTFAGLLLVVCTLSWRVLLFNYEDLERRHAQDDITRASLTIDGFFARIEYITADWAGWDETYRFVADRNRTYAANNLSDSSLAGIDVNFIGYFRSGRPIYLTGFDTGRQRKTAVPSGLLATLQQADFLNLRQPSDTKQGAVVLPGGIMFVAARPILTSTKAGPVRGTLVCGHWLTQTELTALARQSQTSMQIAVAGSSQVSALGVPVNEVRSPSDRVVRVLDQDLVAGFEARHDVLGRPAFYLRTIAPRDIYREGQLSLRYFFVVLSTVSVLIAGIVLALLDRLVLTRVGFLQEQLAHVTLKRDLARRIPVQGNDEISRLAGSVNDLLAMAQSSQVELAKSESRFRAFMDHSPGIAYIVDQHGTIQYANREFHRFHGAVAPGNPMHYSAIWPEAQVQRALQGDATARSEHRVVEAEETLLDASGVERSWIILKFPVEAGEGGHLTGTVGVDITERKAVDRLKAEFVSTVNHELRTPLTAIRGALGLLLGRMSGGMEPGALQLLQIASRNCDRLSVLINDILDLERLDLGKLKFHFAPVDLVQVVADSVSMHEPYGRELGCNYRVTRTLPGAIVRTDKDRLMQVLANLLSNAAKFSPPGQDVSVALEAAAMKDGSPAYRICVHNGGDPIPPSFQVKVFTRFAQADSSDTRRKGGTGLGLSISRDIMEQLGGQIGFESTPEAGTTFHVVLPAGDKGEPGTANCESSSA